MFKWFDKNKKIEEIGETTEVTKMNNVDNYKIDENGNIKIKVKAYDYLYWSGHKEDMIISKSSIISHTKNNIVFKSHKHHFNFESRYIIGNPDSCQSIENKSNLIKFEDTLINKYSYLEQDGYWQGETEDVVGTETVFEKTPLEIFKENFKSKYKLIETEEELNNYLSSTLDCDTWCRKKLYDKMKELGLGDGFISQFADLVGNDLDKYYAMIDLANEVYDKDTLMYLYTYKFGKK